MLQPFSALRRTDETAGAADVDFAFFRNGLGIALGTTFREQIGIALDLSGQVIHKLWNNVARALDHDAVAGTDSKPFNFIAF